MQGAWIVPNNLTNSFSSAPRRFFPFSLCNAFVQRRNANHLRSRNSSALSYHLVAASAKFSSHEYCFDSFGFASSALNDEFAKNTNLSAETHLLRSGIPGKLAKSMEERKLSRCADSRSMIPGRCQCSSDSLSPAMKEDDDDGMITVDHAIKDMEFGTFQIMLLAYSGMAWVAEAMEMMLLSFVGPAVQSSWNLSSTQESIITSMVFAGMMVGAYTWGIISDLKGRRSGFFITSVLTFCAGILSAFSPNYYTLVFLRSLVGVGLAGGPVISSWFLEFIPTPNRGLWMVIISAFWTLGTVSEAMLAWVVMPTLGWRWLLGLSSIPLLVLLVFYPFVPESPRYLATKGDIDEALKILQTMAWLNGKSFPYRKLMCHSHKEIYENKNFEDLSGMEETCLLQGSAVAVSQETGRKPIMIRAFTLFRSLFAPSMVRSTLILWLVFFANAFTYYGLVLLTSQLSGGANNCNIIVSNLASSDITADNLYQDVLVTSLAELPGLLLAAAIVDRYGRKNSMAGFFLLCAVFLLPLLQPLSESVTIFLLFGARACITGAFTIVYIYAPEVYPTKLRTTGLGTANSFARIGGGLCPLVAVDLIKSCQQLLSISLFVCVAVLASAAVFFLPVETTGRALIDNIDDSNL